MSWAMPNCGKWVQYVDPGLSMHTGYDTWLSVTVASSNEYNCKILLCFTSETLLLDSLKFVVNDRLFRSRLIEPVFSSFRIPQM